MRVPSIRVIVGLSAVVLMSVFVIAPSASAGDTPSATTKFVPQSAQPVSSKPIKVIAELSDQPLSVVQANAAAPLTAAQTHQVQSAIAQQQATVSAKINAVGGKVQTRYQNVYNGLVVSIPADRVASLTAMTGVKSVHAVTKVTTDNTRSIPFIGAPSVWSGVAGGGTPYHGEGVKIGIIDTGIDYTHADFGGPGTPAAYQAALATDTAPPDPTMVGCANCRVKGGIDLVGDNYSAGSTPVPDANPLDCNAHGTHVAGTVAGSGVLSDGSTYSGPYDANTVASHTWNVGPGAAPKANIYSIRVFGCGGSTTDDVIISALEWAYANGMQVVNLSLGSTYGGADSPETEAVDNLSRLGTIVVASAGNQGANPYLVGAPSTATSSISVAASNAQPYTDIALSTGSTVHTLQTNDNPPTNLGTLPVVVLPDGSGGISLGCDPAEYQIPAVVGALVVVQRGICDRVVRAIYAQQAGAAAVVMVNNAVGYPPYEGQILSDASIGVTLHVTIPFLGAQPPDATALLAADGATAQFADGGSTDPLASFSSGGARSGDSVLKPDVTAPGTTIISAGMGSGNESFTLSGTSMASPLTTGVAALVRQAHPSWKKVVYWKAAIVNTASADGVTGYQTRTAGAGLIQPAPAVATDAVATGDRSTATLSYGVAELALDYQNTKTVTVTNFANVPVTFDIGTAHDAGSPHSIVAAPSVTVPAKSSAKVSVELVVPAATAGDSSAFRDVAGLVTFTPEAGGNHGISLSVPYYLVPGATSNVHTTFRTRTLTSTGSVAALTTNINGAVAGSADWYEWGLSKAKSVGVPAEINLRAVGAQADINTVSFAISTYGRWSNPASDEFDIDVDVNNDGVVDYIVFADDYGTVTAGSPNGLMGTFVYDVGNNTSYIVSSTTEAPLNDATMVVRVPRGAFCLPSAPCLPNVDGRIQYSVASFALNGGSDFVGGPASFNTTSPSLSVGMHDPVTPGAAVPETLTYNAAEFAQTPGLGFMIVSHDNRSVSGGQAQLIKVVP